MECKICVKAYCQLNQPQVLLCGHTICQECLFNLKSSTSRCPFDRLIIKLANPNYQLMQFLNAQNKSPVFIFNHLSAFNDPLCPSKHLLYLTKNPDKSIIKCNKCSQLFSNSSWNCSLCNYDLCHVCKGDVLCFENHLMIKTNNGHYKCDGCLLSKNDESLYCKICDVDLCKVCAEKVKNIQKQAKFCDFGHKMKWRRSIKVYSLVYNKKYYCCRSCCKKFYKVGSLNCLECETDLCVSCS